MVRPSLRKKRTRAAFASALVILALIANTIVWYQLESRKDTTLLLVNQNGYFSSDDGKKILLQIDRDLPAKLLAEAEGILAWGVKGAVRWFRDGLGNPSEVERANRIWRSESDQLGRFLQECCVTGEHKQVKARQLYEAYRQWTDDVGERAVSEVLFANRMADQGPGKRHTEGGALYTGVGLKVED